MRKFFRTITRLLKEPFHKKDYTYNKQKKRHEPLLAVLVGSKKQKKEIIAWADTGCSTGLHFCKEYVDRKGVTFIRRITKTPHSFSVADGHTIDGHLYKAICEINGEEKEIIVSVIDPKKFFEEEEAEVEPVIPMIGLGLFNEYDVLFKGKKREIALFHPE